MSTLFSLLTYNDLLILCKHERETAMKRSEKLALVLEAVEAQVTNLEMIGSSMGIAAAWSKLAGAVVDLRGAKEKAEDYEARAAARA